MRPLTQRRVPHPTHRSRGLCADLDYVLLPDTIRGALVRLLVPEGLRGQGGWGTVETDLLCHNRVVTHGAGTFASAAEPFPLTFRKRFTAMLLRFSSSLHGGTVQSAKVFLGNSALSLVQQYSTTLESDLLLCMRFCMGREGGEGNPPPSSFRLAGSPTDRCRSTSCGTRRRRGPRPGS